MAYTDLIIRIKNAEAAGKLYLRAPYSKMDKEVADVLQKENFLKKVEVKGRVPKKILKIYFGPRLVEGVKFLSKPSLKRYRGYKDIKSTKGGHGISVVSTSKGVMSGKRARRERVGGQLLFELW